MAESENTEDPTQGKKTEDINTSEPEMMTVTMKSNFYKDSYSRILFVLLLSITLNFGLASTVLYFIANPPQAKYFATSINGRITPLSPLDMPNQSDSAVIQWATQAAIAAYTYNFVNYQNELKTASSKPSLKFLSLPNIVSLGLEITLYSFLPTLLTLPLDLLLTIISYFCPSIPPSMFLS